MPDSIATSATQPSTANPAVQRCTDAWNRIYTPAIAKGELEYFATKAAGEAFRALMPELTTPADIRDFIACTARGILLGAISEKHASKLLYAAQVASGALQREANLEKPKAGRQEPQRAA